MMTKFSIQEIVLSFIKTIFLLIFLEIVSSALFPAMGMVDFKLKFNILIILYMAFKLETPALAYMILITQYIHSAFSIEGWAIGTFTGVLVVVSVKFLKDLLSFSTAISTIVVVQIFQLAWFVVTSFLLSLKLGDFSNFFMLVWQYIPASFVLSIMAPSFFKLLDFFWKVNEHQRGVRI